MTATGEITTIGGELGERRAELEERILLEETLQSYAREFEGSAALAGLYGG